MTQKSMPLSGAVGAGVVRLDGDEKVRGLARYIDDLKFRDCLHGFVVRSPVAHGKLCGVTLDPDFDWSGITVATAEDIPGPNEFVMHDRSMPVLAQDEILYIGEPVAVVAAPTLEQAKEAAAHIQLDIEEQPAITTLDELVDQFKNSDSEFVELCSQTIVKGDVERALAEADHIVEQEYTTTFQEQLYIEPQGLVAVPQDDGGIFIEGSMQCPYYIVHELHEALDLPMEKLRVKQAAVGGAFGGKEEFPSLLAGYCALPAMKAGKPVKIIYDRNQDILYTTKRHPSWVRIRAGLSKDGTILGLKIDYLLNGGAYLTISDVVMYRGILHVAMGYRCGHVFVNGVVGRTNTFPCGAFRGFGAPQATWALESHVDLMARTCGMTPHEFRRKNCLVQGDITPTGQVLKESVGSPDVLEQALERAGFAEKYKRCSRGDTKVDKWYGIGLSFFAHGAGFTGDGEAKIRSRVAVELAMFDDRPKVLLRVSSTEMGQGSATVLPQIAAGALGIDLSFVSCPFPDTSLVPNSGPTVASRTTMVVGSCVHHASLKLKKALGDFPAEDFEDVARAYLEKNGPLRAEHQFGLPPDIKWNQETFEGDAYPGYSWGCNVAEVEVDPLTYEVKVVRVTACFDIGKVINPVLAKGQVEGGLTQALGYAVMENMGIRAGRYDADRMQTYVIPTALDTPEYDITFVEFPYDHAAPGAKGVGEVPMDGLAPAIANAVEAATNIRIRDLPILPEKLLAASEKM